MATIFKRKGSRFYYARFQVDAKDHCVSTGETTRAKAVNAMQRKLAEAKGQRTIDDILRQLEAELRRLPPEDLTVRTRQIARLAPAPLEDQVDMLMTHIQDLPAENRDSTRREIVDQLLQGLESKLSIEDAWDTWLKDPTKRNPGQSTIASYRSQWSRFRDWAESQGLVHLHETTPALARAYASDLWHSSVSPRTYNAHVKFLKALFRILEIPAGITANPWDRIPSMDSETESRRNLTADELTAVCSSATGTLRYLYSLGIYTGMRLGDCVTLNWSAIDRHSKTIEHTPLKTRRKNKIVRIPMHPVLAALLDELQETQNDALLFPEENALYRKDRSAVVKRIQAHFTAAGIQTTEDSASSHRKRRVSRVGFHSLRHSFVSLCAANNVPQVAIMELVGHGSPAMTALYSHAGDAQKGKAIASLPDTVFNPESAILRD
jgi:integrase